MQREKIPGEQRQQLVTISRTMPTRRRLRSVRTPFNPSVEGNPYRLPVSLHSSLTEALAPIKNREAAFRLATLLGRFWSAPGRPTSFPIDRRALSKKDGLELSEARIRGAISTLEILGFIQRVVVNGRTHRVSTDGTLHRRAIMFKFGPEAFEAFKLANAKQVKNTRGRKLSPCQPSSGPTLAYPPMPLKHVMRRTSILPDADPKRYPASATPPLFDSRPHASHTNSPKGIVLTKSKILMGDNANHLEVNHLESALARFETLRSIRTQVDEKHRAMISSRDVRASCHKS